MLDPNWILSYRTETLTEFFRLFPWLTNDYLFLTVVALGYWLRPSSILFRSLGFLVPFATLCNCILKNVFHIPRPDMSLHLINVLDMFGFPSGDVQVGTVFWGTILFMGKSPWRYLCLFPIFGSMISRVYLGIHSVYDVTGGLVFGSMIIYLWHEYLQKRILGDDFSLKTFWYLWAGGVVIYFLSAIDVEWTIIPPTAIGALAGFGLSLQFLNAQNIRPIFQLNIPQALVSLVLLILVAKCFPVDDLSPYMLYLSAIIKYGFALFLMFVLVPKLWERAQKFKP